MDKNSKSPSIVSRHLSKNKKYYTYRTIQKDKQNILKGDINAIIQKFTSLQKEVKSKSRSQPRFVKMLNGHHSPDKGKFLVNSSCFFQQGQQQLLNRKQLRKQMVYYINKLRTPIKNKSSLYQEYIQLTQQTNDYLEYYLTTLTGEDPGKATQLLKEQGKAVTLLILRKKYKCFQTNPQQINNRIFLAFKLNPLNDFQFVHWEKFMKIRKLISGQFNRKDCIDFLLDYFFVTSNKPIKGSEFWLIFSSTLRKLETVSDGYNLEVLINKIKDVIEFHIHQDMQLTQNAFQKIILLSPAFIWHEFVSLIFV